MMILPIDQGVSGEHSPPLRLHNVVVLNNVSVKRVQMKWKVGEKPPQRVLAR